ncbi:hypothetical protein GS979_07565 [Rhodococcus hoagii]|nr:hypothetical protein [Prescottella equi]
MVNCQDYSDLHPDAAHISSPVIPAAIALAERQGNITGRDFITAVALGVDLQCRLTVAAASREGFPPPGTRPAVRCVRSRFGVQQTAETRREPDRRRVGHRLHSSGRYARDRVRQGLHHSWLRACRPRRGRCPGRIDGPSRDQRGPAQSRRTARLLECLLPG